MLAAPEQVQGGKRLARQLLARDDAAPRALAIARKGGNPRLSGYREKNPPLLEREKVVCAGRELGGEVESGRDGVGIEIRFDLARNDQRRARFVDQHAVGLVHDGEMQPAQPQLARARGFAVHRLQLQGEIAVGLAEQNAVAQIVERQLLVGAIGDVARIGGAPFLGARPVARS